MNARYANQHGYSDVFPFEVVRAVNEKCVEVRAMDYALDPNWKPDFVPGGFVGHVANNRDQSYAYSSRPDFPVQRVRLHKNGRWFDKDGRRYVFADRPMRFYDYNF